MRFPTLMLRPLVLGTLCAAAVVTATPSTQIWIPSTDVQAFLNPHLGWDVYAGTHSAGGILSNGGITVGILPFKRSTPKSASTGAM